jgi:phosphonate transport system ATP-binding protein
MSAHLMAVHGSPLHPRDQAGAARALTFSLAGVGRAFGDFRALQPAHLSIQSGERVALLGPSGAGKSTLLRLLSTALMPTEGELRVLGADPSRLGGRGLRALRTRIGVIHQQFLLVPQASVFQNVVAGRLGHLSVARAILSMLSSAEAQRVHAVLSEVGLGSHLYERVDRLSSGEQQRVAIARMLYQDPEVIIADEPLASVDPVRAVDLVRLLSHFARGRTLIVSTHQLEPVLPFVTRVIGLRKGAVHFDKRTDELRQEDLKALYETVPLERTAQNVVHMVPRTSSARATEPQLITVGVGHGVEVGGLLRRLTELLKDRPGLRFKVCSTRSETLLQEVQAGRLDLALVDERRPASQELETEQLVEDPVLLVASPAFAGLPSGRVSASVVAGLPRVDWEHGSQLRAAVEEHFARSGTPLEAHAAVLELAGTAELMEAVAAGAGVAFVSSLAARPWLRSGALRQVPMSTLEELRHPLFAVYRKSSEKHGLLLELLGLVREAFGTLSGLGQGAAPRVELGS